MEDLQAQLRDISGLDQLNNWPPAPIWWLLFIALIIILSVIFYFIRKKISYKNSWEFDALGELRELEERLNNENAHQSLVKLSELIKRILIAKYGRENCASLSGKKLLIWLAKEDPNRFDWQQYGTILADKVYAPDRSDIDIKQIKLLISAIKKWLHGGARTTRGQYV